MLCLLAVAVTCVSAATVNPTKQYPRFQVGASGIWATIEPGRLVTVADTEAGTPAAGKVATGDVILTANGRSLAVPDPRVPLGEALGAAEASGGKFALTIKRGDAEKRVVIDIPVLGPYSATWPLKCNKSKTIIKQTAEKLVKTQQADGFFNIGGRSVGGSLTGCMAALFLLSTGDDAYMPNVRKYAHAMAKGAQVNPTGSSWHLGYQLILLGEYYLRTGDRKVTPAMKALSAKTLKGQIARSWGHGMTDTSVGYVQSGQMNSAGVTVLLGLTLARECGIVEAEEPFMKAMVFFYRMPGHGSICYGDHRAEIYVDTNGRNSAISCAMSLLDGEVYDMSAKHLAMLVADSYFAPEAGHTGGGVQRYVARDHRRSAPGRPATPLPKAHGEDGVVLRPVPPAEREFPDPALPGDPLQRRRLGVLGGADLHRPAAGPPHHGRPADRPQREDPSRAGPAVGVASR